MKVGFIGLGIMGSRMAANLQAQGHTLVVYNRTRDKAQALLDGGAIWAENPAAVAVQAEVMVTMLAHPDAVRDCAVGEQGFVAALESGKVWLDCSTVNPSFTRTMAAAAEERGIRCVDAPVAGSKNQAADAALIFLAGGDADDVTTCQPLFDAMGSRVVHVGETGMGSSLKMVVNMLLATSMAAFAEGVALGRSLGLPEEMLLTVLIGGPVAAPFLAGKRTKMHDVEAEPEFPLQWMHKDLHLATISAYETGSITPIASLAQELYRMAIQTGYGEADFSTLYAYLNRGETNTQ